MQSDSNSAIADNGDKSLAEWPTLNDVCSNVKQTSQNGGVAKNGRKDQKRTNSPADKTEGYDSSKENEDSTHQPNSRGARKKGSRQKWVPVPIAPPPYRKRFERGGRPAYESNRNGAVNNCEKKTESCENGSIPEQNRTASRGSSRTRGKRGRGASQNWRQHREDTPHSETQSTPEPNDSSPEEPLQAVMYYDPYMHSCYTTAMREKELKKAIRIQIEYYFSEENLISDIFIRRKMDDLGFVPLSLIAGFHRVASLTKDLVIIAGALEESDKLEIVDGMKIRPIVDPLRWPLRDNHILGLRTDVPEFVPGQPYVREMVEGIRGISFFSESTVHPSYNGHFMPNGYSDQYIPNGVINHPETQFDNMPQNTPVEASS